MGIKSERMKSKKYILDYVDYEEGGDCCAVCLHNNYKNHCEKVTLPKPRNWEDKPWGFRRVPVFKVSPYGVCKFFAKEYTHSPKEEAVKATNNETYRWNKDTDESYVKSALFANLDPMEIVHLMKINE